MIEAQEDHKMKKELFPQFQAEPFENRKSTLEKIQTTFGIMRSAANAVTFTVFEQAVQSLPNPDYVGMPDGNAIPFSDLDLNAQTELIRVRNERLRGRLSVFETSIQERMDQEKNTLIQAIKTLNEGYEKALAYISDPLTSSLGSPISRLTGNTSEQFSQLAKDLHRKHQEQVEDFLQDYLQKMNTLRVEIALRIRQEMVNNLKGATAIPSDEEIYMLLLRAENATLDGTIAHNSRKQGEAAGETNNPGNTDSTPLDTADAVSSDTPPETPEPPKDDLLDEEAIKSYWRRFSEIQSQEYYHGYGGILEFENWVAFPVRRDGDTTNTPALVVFPKNPTDSLRINDYQEELKIRMRLLEFLQASGFNAEEYDTTVLERESHILVTATRKGTSPHVAKRRRPTLNLEPLESDLKPDTEHEPQSVADEYMFNLIQEDPETILQQLINGYKYAVSISAADHSSIAHTIFTPGNETERFRAELMKTTPEDYIFVYSIPRIMKILERNQTLRSDFVVLLKELKKGNLGTQQLGRFLKNMFHPRERWETDLHRSKAIEEIETKIRKEMEGQPEEDIRKKIQEELATRDTYTQLSGEPDKEHFFSSDKSRYTPYNPQVLDVARTAHEKTPKRAAFSERKAEWDRNPSHEADTQLEQDDDELSMREKILSKMRVREKLDKLKEILMRRKKEKREQEINETLETTTTEFIQTVLEKNVDGHGQKLLKRMQEKNAQYAVISYEWGTDYCSIDLAMNSESLPKSGLSNEDGKRKWVDIISRNHLQEALDKLPSNP